MLKCKLCEYKTDSQLSLSKHTSFVHKLKFSNYLIKVKYNNVHPVCECGCGEKTRYEANKADFNKWIHGHQSRVVGHFGDPKAKKRVNAIIKTRKEKFTSGEYNHILKYVRKKRSKKIKTKISNTKKEQWITGNIGRKKYAPSKLEKIFANILDLLDIKYETAYYASEIKAFYDFYIPEYNTIIEVDGDFWHSNPIKYPNGPVNKCQIKNALRDKVKNDWVIKHGYKLLRFWEYDINNNIKQVKKILLENLVK